MRKYGNKIRKWGSRAILVLLMAAVPVRQQQNAVFGIGIDLGDDVAQLQVNAVEGGYVAGLFNHRGAIASKRVCQIVAAAPMSIGARHARTEINLCLEVCHA